MAHTVIPPPRGTTATLELAHKGNISDKTIPERDREVRDFNVTLVASAIMQVYEMILCILSSCNFLLPVPLRFQRVSKRLSNLSYWPEILLFYVVQSFIYDSLKKHVS